MPERNGDKKTNEQQLKNNQWNPSKIISYYCNYK